MELKTLAVLAGGAALLAACAAGPGEAQRDALAMMKRDFHARGIAGMERLTQDEVQATCNKHHDNPPPALAERLQKAQMDTQEIAADLGYRLAPSP